MKQNLQWEKISEIKQGKEIIKTFKMPDGTIKSFPIRDQGLGASVVAKTPDNQFILVRQYRPGPERILHDLPGGDVDEGETPLEAAKRELLEEAGYTGDFEELGFDYTSAYSNEKMYSFLATNCKKVQEPQLDDGEFAEVELVSLERLKEIAETGDITNSAPVYRALKAVALHQHS
ncbi:MAG: NUDIX hydrolase [Weeksellaceae bacterium]